MHWVRLSELSDDALYRGARLRFTKLQFGDRPQMVEFMLFIALERESSLGLVQTSGYDSGDVFVLLPSDSVAKGAVAVSVDWLKTNSKKWLDAEASEVWVSTDNPDIVH